MAQRQSLGSLGKKSLKPMLFAGLLSSFVLYQNCAQNMGSSGGSDVSVGSSVVGSLSQNPMGPNQPPEDDSTVSIDDQTGNLASLNLSFSETNRLVPQQDALIIAQGQCSAQQNGAVLYWSFKDGQSQLLQEGFANCQQTQFVVHIPLQQPLDCAKNYQLNVYLGTGTPALMNIRANCQ